MVVQKSSTHRRMARVRSLIEQRQLRWMLFIVCCTVAFSLCIICNQSSMNLEIYKLLKDYGDLKKPDNRTPEPVCNLSNSRSDAYQLDGDIRVDGRSSTVFIANSQDHVTSWSVKPYTRKFDPYVMNFVKRWRISAQQAVNLPSCDRKIESPAVLFSSGGYAGNQFHDFTDVLIPLYLTSRQFNATAVFLLTDKRYPWTRKYMDILQKLSMYEIINIDKENKVLCFPRMIIGLRSHKEFGIDVQQYPYYSMKDYREFLRGTYLLERRTLPRGPCFVKPRLLVISRKTNRLLKNEDRVADWAQIIGFHVITAEIDDKNMTKVSRYVNSFDVIMGVHGAGLANMVYLPDNAVVIEIVPFGVDSLARPYFNIPSKEMNLRYIEYKVSLEESSLLGRYPADSEVYRHPGEIQSRGFLGFRSIYLDNQDVTLDLYRFRRALLRALSYICG